MIKTVLALVEDADKAQGFVESVLTLAEFRQAHVLFDLLTPAPMMAADLGPLGTRATFPFEMQEIVSEQEDKLRSLLPEGAPAEILSQAGDAAWLPGEVRRTAPLADLVVVGPKEAWSIDRLRRRSIETLLLGGGVPVLLLPSGRSLRRVDHAVFGWKPGAPARRVVRDLIGMAAPGARIDVVQVRRGPGDEPDLGPVRAYLSRHGFAVEPHALDPGERVADILQAFAADRGADLLAIGGYARSRVREILFGGVTRTIVDDPRVPVLMAH